MKRLIVVASLLVFGVSPSWAHDSRMIDLKDLSSKSQLKGVGYCKGEYHLELKDGSSQRIREFNLRMKTDSGPHGPRPGVPVFLGAGMRGDRAFLIFSSPEEMKAFVKVDC